jgi:hypothetical protein
LGGIADSLRDAVKKLAYKTSVDQLKRRGVRNVNVLGLDRVAFLIQEAVSRSLRYKMLSLDRERLASATREEFMNLVQSNEDLTRSHDELRRLKEKAEEQVDQLRRELNAQQALLKKKLMLAESESQAQFKGEDAVIAEKVLILFEGVKTLEDMDLDHLRERVLELVSEIVQHERREAIAAREKARDRDVDLLQRRIAKLNINLKETEHQLREVIRVKNIDEGISSMYREVQGLDEADSEFERKLALMTDLFKANLRLQKKKRRMA